MLRYFYFLGIIYFINSSFCYDYLNEVDHQRMRESGNHEDEYSHKKFRPEKRNSHRQRQQYSLDNVEPVAQFDVAEFMLGYDSMADVRPRQANPPRDFRRRNFKDYNSYDSFDSLFNLEANEKRGDSWANAIGDEQNNIKAEAPSTAKMLRDQPNEKNQDYSYTGGDDKSKENFEHNNYLSKSIYDPPIIARSPTVHHQQKKGVLKNIRFPFFSRNKAKTLAPTKDRKRMTSKNHKSDISKSLVDLNDQVVSDNKDSLYVVHLPGELLNKKKREKKRSYFEKFCPSCKKKFVPNEKAVPRSEQVTDKMVHNSRQYFQNQVVNRSSSKDKKTFASMPESGRERRQFLEDKERQIKELEEVAKKVESVDVSFSVRPSGPTTLFFSQNI